MSLPQPFTPAGVAIKMAEKYALSDPALMAEAALIRSDLKDWVKGNFLLEEDQFDFLDAIDSMYTEYLAQNLAMAVAHRRPVTLTVSSPPPMARFSKWLETKSTLVTSYNPSGGLNVSGSLVFDELHSS